ncbi:16S rRNA (guanine(966)-N(2))-methyltransferase RsmD [Mycoplasma sp. P36-A1]|uniref:16S rRNA (guanine(966)-N(2))-methyltransferase RsmD n=1 Tax=Mycoplasma sp. P36-A1 TaxID=3252900 RepID=UPI003C2CB89F
MDVNRGNFKGLKLETLSGENTRPTQSRVKEAIFSMLSNNVYDAKVLDLFAGSGALGIESLSNNAKRVDFVDSNIDAIKVINNNLNKLKDCEYKVHNIDYNKALINFKESNQKFDLIFLDPPYKQHLINKLLIDIEKLDLINEFTIIVCESNLDENVISETSKLELYKEKKYGNTKIRMFRRK